MPGPTEDDPGDPESVARGLCLRALTGTPKTRQQLAELLARHGIPDNAATTVLDRFTEVGLIDDAAYARAWVSSRQAGRGLARRALSAELRAKGIDAEVAAEAVELVDDDDERTAARRLVQRRLAGMRRLDRATATRRLIGMLARKGYSGGLAAAVVREALDALPEEGRADGLDDGSVDGLGFDEDSLLP
jgi:regulatory protein